MTIRIILSFDNYWSYSSKTANTGLTTISYVGYVMLQYCYPIAHVPTGALISHLHFHALWAVHCLILFFWVNNGSLWYGYFVGFWFKNASKCLETLRKLVWNIFVCVVLLSHRAFLLSSSFKTFYTPGSVCIFSTRFSKTSHWQGRFVSSLWPSCLIQKWQEANASHS